MEHHPPFMMYIGISRCTEQLLFESLDDAIRTACIKLGRAKDDEVTYVTIYTHDPAKKMYRLLATVVGGRDTVRRLVDRLARA